MHQLCLKITEKCDWGKNQDGVGEEYQVRQNFIHPWNHYKNNKNENN